MTNDPIHPHTIWITTVFAMCAASGIEHLAEGISQHEVSGIALTVNNSNDEAGDFAPWQIKARRGGVVVATMTPSTSVFDADVDDFVAVMRAALPKDHHLFAPVEQEVVAALTAAPIDVEVQASDTWMERR